MLKVSETVKNLVLKSEIALASLIAGHLNLSAYAKQIRPEVEELTKKPVTKGSIVIALSRLAKELYNEEKYSEPLVPKLILENIVVKSGLIEYTLDKTKDNLKVIQKLYHHSEIKMNDLFMISQGINEITLITTTDNIKTLDKLIKPAKPKIIIDDLVAVSITFSAKQLTLPNIIFALVRALAIKKINIIEIVSTRSELAFIVKQADLQNTFTTLNEIYQQK